jgi:hypothetical protein
MELAILTELEGAHPRLLKRSVLEAELRLLTDDFTTTAFDRALSALDKKRQVRIYDGEDVTRVGITDDGLNRVASAR